VCHQYQHRSTTVSGDSFLDLGKLALTAFHVVERALQDIHGCACPKARRAVSKHRQRIRDGGAFDAVVDFDKALCDPDHPTRMLAIYDCGDHLHPSDLGYNTMGDAVNLALFD
jgi:hypothetical protein